MKSKLQLMINGKPVLIPIELSEEQLRQLTAAVNLDEVDRKSTRLNSSH